MAATEVRALVKRTWSKAHQICATGIRDDTEGGGSSKETLRLQDVEIDRNCYEIHAGVSRLVASTNQVPTADLFRMIPNSSQFYTEHTRAWGHRRKSPVCMFLTL